MARISKQNSTFPPPLYTVAYIFPPPTPKKNPTKNRLCRFEMSKKLFRWSRESNNEFQCILWQYHWNHIKITHSLERYNVVCECARNLTDKKYRFFSIYSNSNVETARKLDSSSQTASRVHILLYLLKNLLFIKNRVQ